MFRIVKLGTTEKLIIAITTSRFSSGAKYTASSITATFYKVNAGGDALEIDTAIGTSGVVTLSADTGSKTGYHTALLDVSALTTKIYSVVIEATVDSVAAVSHEFLDINAERKKVADYVDASIATRSTYAGGAVASVTGAVGSVTGGVTITTNNDKTGYELISAYDAAKTAAPTVGQIDTQLSSSHGSGVWGSSIGSGINTIVLTVYETGTITPIAEYEVSFYNSDLTICYGTLETSTLGIITTNLDDGTYKLKGHRLGYNAVNPVETFIVDSTHLTKTIYATPVTEPGTGEWATESW